MQQYLLLQRNLVYPGITREKKLVVLIGQRKALAVAVRNNRTGNRLSGLLARLVTPDLMTDCAKLSVDGHELNHHTRP